MTIRKAVMGCMRRSWNLGAIALLAGLATWATSSAGAEEYRDLDEGPAYSEDCTKQDPEPFRRARYTAEARYHSKALETEVSLKSRRERLDARAVPNPVPEGDPAFERIRREREQYERERAGLDAEEEEFRKVSLPKLLRERDEALKSYDDSIAGQERRYNDCIKRQAPAREEYQLKLTEQILFEALILAGAMAQSEEDVERFQNSVHAHRRREKLREDLRRPDEAPQTLAPEQPKKVVKKKPPAERVKRADGPQTPSPTREVHSPDATAVTIMLLGAAAGAASQGLNRRRDHSPPPRQPSPHGHW